MINKIADVTYSDLNNHKNRVGEFFFPITSTRDYSPKKELFTSNSVFSFIISDITNKQIVKNFNFEESVRKHFEELGVDKKYIDIIFEIYFKSNLYLKLSPLTYQIYKNEKDKSKQIYNSIFKPFLSNIEIDNIENSDNLNFIEQEILNTILKSSKIEEKRESKQIESYLEFLRDVTTKDFKYLMRLKNNFDKNIDYFIKFYTFIYSTQFMLNLKPYFFETPKIREFYFILNSEKASKTRKELEEFSYKTLFAKLDYLFPYLSMLETLAKISGKKDLRFYEISKLIEENNKNIEIIDNFNKRLRKMKQLELKLINSKSLKDAFDNLLKSAYEEFNVENNSKKDVSNKYKKAFETHIAKNFIQSRGSFGKVAVLNSEMLLFLTNMAIGEEKEYLYFDDLLLELKNRGVFFDQKSKETILELFEKIGNIERKSDSGDAIYVYKTV